MNYVTIPNVEIAHVGMDWPASTGPVTLSLQHLADAVAAVNDPHILQPRIKIGHTDPRFNEFPPVHDPFAYHGTLNEDGNPAFGRFANLRLANDGGEIRGDMVEVPEWLAQAMPSAYPTRSLEGDFDIETPGGKRYSFVLTAVAVGGVWLPAISCLEDLERLLVEGPDGVVAAQAARRTPVTARRTAMPVEAAAAVDQVVHQFFNDFAVGDRYWWWPVSVWVDPNQIIADDDEGHLYRVPFTTDGDGNASFGDPVRVVTQYRDVPENDNQPAVAAAPPAAAFTASSAVRPRDRVRAATTTEEEHMVPIAPTAVLERLGLPEDATEADLLAALDNEQTPDPENDTETTTTATATVQLPVAASASTVTVDREQWEQTQRDARDGAAARAAQVQASREQFVDDAVQAGKFPPSRRSHYLGLMAADDVGARQLIDGLAAGLVPTEERGTAPAAETAPADLGWFPQYATTTQEGQ